RGHGRGRPGPQLARLLVGMAPADGVRLRLRLLQRPRAVRPRGLLVQPVPGHLPPGDDPADPPRARGRPGGAGRGPDGARPVGRVVADLADRFDLTEGQAQVLERAAEALLAEREQISRLRALVAVGAEARVSVDERPRL